MPENMQNKAKADNVRKKNIPRVRCNHKNMQPLEISLKTRKNETQSIRKARILAILIMVEKQTTAQ